MGKAVKTKVTTRALRTVRKYGGIDAYLANRDDAILGKWGRAMRDKIASVVYAKRLKEEVQANAAAMIAEGDKSTNGFEDGPRNAEGRMLPPGLSREEQQGLSSHV